jgi:long-chain fatty acid transport protein
MAQHYKLKLGSFLIASTLSSMSCAAGFAIIEQSVTGLGRAFAGSAAVAEDASTIFFNPAGLTNLSHAELDIGLNYIAPRSEFKDGGSSSPFGAPLTGGNGGDAGNNAIVPNIYYSHAITERTVFGLGINAPFGLVTEYNDTWQGRYHAVKSDLKTININPSLAFKVTDKLSVGFGIDLQKIELTLTKMADLGAVGGTSTSQTADGKVNLEADDWSLGYNLGLTYQIQQSTRLGLAYRSKISHTLEGYGTLHASTGELAADGNISGSVDLPESLSFAIHHQINQQWAIMGDVSWTRWSRFKELAINSDGTLPSSVKPENWENSMRYGLGLTYEHNYKWVFRGGVAFDETPISDEFRTSRIPGEDRKWVALGASYKYSDNIILDAGYTHIFFSDPTINDTDDRGYTLKGNYEASVDILGMQMRWLFL